MGNSLRFYGSAAKPESRSPIWGRRQTGKVATPSSWNLRVRSPSSSLDLLSYEGNKLLNASRFAGAIITREKAPFPSGIGDIVVRVASLVAPEVRVQVPLSPSNAVLSMTQNCFSYLGHGIAWGGHLSGREEFRRVRFPYAPPNVAVWKALPR